MRFFARFKARIVAARSIFQTKPFSTATAEGRALERVRRVAWTAVASGAARGTSVVVAFVSVPLTLRYLGPERYGLWMSITSLLVILNFSDLGLSLGLVSALANADGMNSRDAARRYVASSVWMLAACSTVLIVIVGVSYEWVPWARFFNVSSPLAVSEAGLAAATFLVVGALSLPLGVMGRIQQGFQEGFVANVYQCLGSLLSLIFLLIAIKVRAGLPWLILAVAGAPSVATIINIAISALGKYRWLSIRWSYVTPSVVRTLYRTGAAIFALQLGYAIAYNSDNIVIARVIGPIAVAQYSVCARLFSISTVAVTLVTTPIWSAYAEAHARGDSLWLTTTVRRVLKLGLLSACIPALLFIAFGRPIIRVWAGPNMSPDYRLLIGLAVWVMLDSIRITSMTFMSATGRFRFQILSFMLFVPVSLLARVLGARASGLAGMVWANIGCLIVLVAGYTSYTRQLVQSPVRIESTDAKSPSWVRTQIVRLWQ
jgi:O-antigen/teichoic acid export membrane protein